MQYNTEFCYTRSTNRHRKELDNIKIPPKNNFNHTPTQLKNLLMAAQRFEQPAIDKLCADFTPLINKEAHRQSVFNALGEDAVNIAWEIFLEFIHSYKGNNYRLLPGLIQKHLHYRLLDRLHQKGCLLDCDALDADETFADTIADKHDYIAEADTRLSINTAVSKLSDKQQTVIRELYLHDKDIKTFTGSTGLNVQTCYTHKMRALSILKKQLAG